MMQMPYLHWETDKRRENIATEIAAVTLAQKPGKVVNANLQHNVVGLVNTLDRRADGKKSTSYKPNETAPMRPVHGLARYLMHASRVYQDMDIDSDVSLLQARLHEEPPLHTRRTLDQSYFWNLENTGHRDRDQASLNYIFSEFMAFVEEQGQGRCCSLGKNSPLYESYEHSCIRASPDL